MSEQPKPDRLREGSPESFGYVKAPHHSTAEEIAYERPDGSIALFPRRAGTVPTIRLRRGQSVAGMTKAREWAPRGQAHQP